MTLRVLACLAVLTAQTGGPEPPRPALPPEIVERLDRDYRHWRIAPLPEGIPSDLAGAEPNVLRRDFDGDGAADVVVLIEYQAGASETDFMRRAIAFMGGAKPLAVTDAVPPEPTGPFLSLARKGERKYDLDQDRRFTLARDAIDVLYHERGPCTTFVFRSGRFHAFWTCD